MIAAWGHISPLSRWPVDAEARIELAKMEIGFCHFWQRVMQPEGDDLAELLHRKAVATEHLTAAECELNPRNDIRARRPASR